MKKMVLAFIALSIFDANGMRAFRRAWSHSESVPQVSVQPREVHKLDSLRLERPPIVFSKMKRMPNSLPVCRNLYRNSVNSEFDMVARIKALKGEFGPVGFRQKSVSSDNLLRALNLIEESSDSESLKC